MQCPQCNHENPEGVKFCGECGAKLERLCPSCGKSNPPANKFCYECGCRLAGSESEAVTPASSLVSIPATIDYHSRLASYTPKHLIDKVASQLQDQEIKQTFLAAKPVRNLQERLTLWPP